MAAATMMLVPVVLMLGLQYFVAVARQAQGCEDLMTAEAISSRLASGVARSAPARAAPKPKTVTVGRIGVYAFLILAALFFLMPLWVMVVTSLKTMPEIQRRASVQLAGSCSPSIPGSRPGTPPVPVATAMA
jgi:hypothetical protein